MNNKGKIKEYGGFLPIDSRNREYYNEDKNYSIKRLNAARYAIVVAVRELKCSKIWIPTYICKTVVDTLDKYKIIYSYYSIDNRLMPCLKEIADDECVLAVNYFSHYCKEYYNEISSKYNKVIFDNTQSFFSEPVIRKNVFNVYSPRKFVGVTDGAYLIGKDEITECDFAIDCSYQRSIILLSSFELGTDKVYDEYLQGEESICVSGIKEMSKLTRCLLGNVDYESVMIKRIENYNYLAKELADINQLKVDCITDFERVPMVYPFLWSDTNKAFRNSLLSNKVYIPQWWKWVLSQPHASDIERNLSTNLHPLPIDQRYNISDMSEIVKIVRKGIKVEAL